MKKLLLTVLSIVVVPGFLVGGERVTPPPYECFPEDLDCAWREISAVFRAADKRAREESNPLADHAQAIVARTGVANIAGIAEKNEDGDYVTIFEHRISRSIGNRSMFNRPDAPTASPVLPTGTCDSIEECEKKLQQLCEDFKDDNLKEGSAKLTVAPNGTVTCGGTCTRTKAEPFATCGKPNKS